jgi:hypothetical protein
VISAIPWDEIAEGYRGPNCDVADGTGNDHDGRDVRDFTIFCVVFVAVVAIVSRIRQPSFVFGR